MSHDAALAGRSVGQADTLTFARGSGDDWLMNVGIDVMAGSGDRFPAPYRNSTTAV